MTIQPGGWVANDIQGHAGIQMASFLAATEFLDIEHESVRAFTASAIDRAGTDREKAVRLFAAVRDQIWYDPYTVSEDPAH